MCHGSFATATCIRCHHKVSAEAIKGKVLAGEVPFCTLCSNEEETKAIQFPLGEPRPEPPSRRGTFDEDDEDDEMYQVQETFPLPPVVKPDIVFFGEDLPDEFHNNLQKDKPDCDLVLVIGSSLRVRPVSLIPGEISS
jgi:NAD-dependent histone deacetylase SIR2